MLPKVQALFLSITFLLFTTVVLAQDTLAVSYFTRNNLYTTNHSKAYYVRIIKKPDSGSVFYNIFEYYINGTPKFLGKSSKKEYLVLNDKYTEFFPSGKSQEVGFYKIGMRVGKLENYYPNGTLYTIKEYPSTIENRQDDGELSNNEYLITTCKDSTGKALVVNGNGYYIGYSDNFKIIEEEGDVKSGLRNGIWKGNNEKSKISFEEKYKDGKLISGVSKSKDGLITKYTKRATSPAYQGGLEEFYRFLGQNIKYPSYSRELNIQGKVIISFVIEKDGKLTEIKVIKPVSNDIDAEAVRVIKQSPNWIPGNMYGRNVRVLYSIPIDFSLN